MKVINSLLTNFNNNLIASAKILASKEKINSLEPKLLWEKKLDNSPAFNPPALGNDGILYASNQNGNLFAIDGKTKEVKWCILSEVNHGLCTIPSLVKDDILYQLNSGSKISAIDTKGSNGIHPEWNYKTAVNIISPLKITSKNLLYLFDEYDNVHAVDSITGKNKWEHKIYERIVKNNSQEFRNNNISFNEPIYCFADNDTTLFIATCDNYLLKFNALDGKFITKFNLPAPPSTPLIPSPDNKLFFGCNDSFYCIDEENGKIIWENKISKPNLSKPYFSGYYLSKKGILFLGTSSNSIEAIDTKTGKTIWKKEIYHTDKLAKSNSPFAVSPDEKTMYIAMGDWFPGINAYDTESWKEIWYARMGKTVNIPDENKKEGFKLQITKDGSYLFLSHKNFIAVFNPPKQTPIFLKNLTQTTFCGDILISEKDGIFFLTDSEGKISAYSYENHLGNYLKIRETLLRGPTKPSIKKNSDFVEIGDIKIPVNKTYGE